MQALNSCVDTERLNTQGSRDPASRLTQIADKRREWAKPAETDEQKQERLTKRRREIGADPLLNLPMQTCQHECLAAETTPERDARFYSEWETAEKERPGLNVTEQDMPLFSAVFHPNQDAQILCKDGYIGYISLMLVSFPDSSLCPSWQRVMEEEESKMEDCLSRWSSEDCCYPYPSANLKDN